MRIVRLVLLGLLVYVVSIVALFPAAPVVDRVRDQLGPVALGAVSGRLYDGEVSTVRYTDDLLPLEFTDVGWTLAPQSLLKGGAGAEVRFRGYGGGGQGEVIREWDGDLHVSDFDFSADATALQALLPVPIAEFSGTLNGSIDEMLLEGELLTLLEGTFNWQDAVLQRPIRLLLGNLTLAVQRDGVDSHVVQVNAVGGEILAEGTINMALDGDYSANVVFTPAADASAEAVGGLQQFARPEAGGRYRFQQSGNVTRLM